MNGTIANEVIIFNIASALCGDEYLSLSQTEKNIVRTLHSAGWVRLEGDYKIVKMTDYGNQFKQ